MKKKVRERHGVRKQGHHRARRFLLSTTLSKSQVTLDVDPCTYDTRLAAHPRLRRRCTVRVSALLPAIRIRIRENSRIRKSNHRIRDSKEGQSPKHAPGTLEARSFVLTSITSLLPRASTGGAVRYFPRALFRCACRMYGFYK